MTELRKLKTEELEFLMDDNFVTEITKNNKPLAYLIPEWMYRLAKENKTKGENK